MLKSKSILLTILYVKCGTDVGMRVGTDLFEYLKCMGRDVITRVLNSTSNNGSDATNAIVIAIVSSFLGAPQEIMESLATDCKPMFDLVLLCVVMLIKHCNNNEQNLQEIHDALTAISMKMKLQSYEKKLVQEPAIIAVYLKLQILKPSDTAELLIVTNIVSNILQRRYSAKISSTKSKDLSSKASCNSLFAAMF
ncbi:hypothetical protein AXG93_3719s1330 [Marchantia polymorpha subsp. ruderalis]|uniref:Uncharacterized protein n=1 Tax=Marchantia polymorpha subsp. ruderalis TaxID=1480154 RepID=A0A176VNT3_MARPO|nr:hypothetical protein AXG93_3719s1330 [Marchantia polymorpha subsp. ruderalis]